MRQEDLIEDGFEFDLPLQTEHIDIDPFNVANHLHDRPVMTEMTPRRNEEDLLFDQLIQNTAEEIDYMEDELMHQESLLD